MVLPETPQGDASSPAASDASTVSVTRRTTTTGARLHPPGSDAGSPVPPFQLQAATAPSAASEQREDDCRTETAQAAAATAASTADMTAPQGNSQLAHDGDKSAPVSLAAAGRHFPADTMQLGSAAELRLTASAALLHRRAPAADVTTPLVAAAATVEPPAEAEPNAPHTEVLPAAAIAATPTAAQAETPAAAAEAAGSAKPSAARSVVGSIMGAAWSAAGLWSGNMPTASCPPTRPAPTPASQPALDAGHTAAADRFVGAPAMLQQGALLTSPSRATATVSDCESPDVFSTPEGELPPSPGSLEGASCGLAPLPCGLTIAAMNDAMSVDAACDAAGEAAAAPESETGRTPPCKSAAPVQMLSISPLPGSQPDAGPFHCEFTSQSDCDASHKPPENSESAPDAASCCASIHSQLYSLARCVHHLLIVSRMQCIHCNEVLKCIEQCSLKYTKFIKLLCRRLAQDAQNFIYQVSAMLPRRHRQPQPVPQPLAAALPAVGAQPALPGCVLVRLLGHRQRLFACLPQRGPVAARQRVAGHCHGWQSAPVRWPTRGTSGAPQSHRTCYPVALLSCLCVNAVVSAARFPDWERSFLNKPAIGSPALPGEIWAHVIGHVKRQQWGPFQKPLPHLQCQWKATSCCDVLVQVRTGSGEREVTPRVLIPAAAATTPATFELPTPPRQAPTPVLAGSLARAAASAAQATPLALISADGGATPSTVELPTPAGEAPTPVLAGLQSDVAAAAVTPEPMVALPTPGTPTTIDEVRAHRQHCFCPA